MTLDPVSKLGLPASDPEAGVHAHGLDRAAGKTLVDGPHLHLFRFPDGSLVLTLEDGDHDHGIEAGGDKATKGGKHTHRVQLTIGSTLETLEDGEHDHDLLVDVTAFDGTHDHWMELPDGNRLKTVSAGEFAELNLRPSVGSPGAASEILGKDAKDEAINVRMEDMQHQRGSSGARLIKAPFKTEGGKRFPAAAFAYVPELMKPSTWKLKLFDNPGDVPDRPSVRLTAAAASALSPRGFRGQPVQLPDQDRGRVKQRVAAAWIKARRNQGKTVSSSDLPPVLKNIPEGEKRKKKPYKKESSDATLTVTGSESGIEALTGMLGHIKDIGNIGHSFGIIIDPETSDHRMNFSWDGDGPYRIHDIRSSLGATQKDDLSVQNLEEDGGLLVEESVGVFIRVPPSIARKFQENDKDPSPVHSTMLQVGDQDKAGFERVVAAVRKVAAIVPPFDVEMTDFGEFKNPAGLAIPHMIPRSKSEISFEDIHKRLRTAVTQQGIDPEHHDGPFKPHVTLAYGKFRGERPEATFKVATIEVWGRHGGTFGRVVIQLGSGDEVKRISSTKRQMRVIAHKQEEDERTALGIVLEPEVVDSQNDIYSEAEIRKTAFMFMERYQNFGLMHKQMRKDILPLESYLAPVDFEIDGQKVKKGTWLLRVRVLDDGIWSGVKSGKFTGFSIGGDAIRTIESSRAAA